MIPLCVSPQQNDRPAEDWNQLPAEEIEKCEELGLGNLSITEKAIEQKLCPYFENKCYTIAVHTLKNYKISTYDPQALSVAVREIIIVPDTRMTIGSLFLAFARAFSSKNDTRYLGTLSLSSILSRILGSTGAEDLKYFNYSLDRRTNFKLRMTIDLTWYQLSIEKHTGVYVVYTGASSARKVAVSFFDWVKSFFSKNKKHHEYIPLLPSESGIEEMPDDENLDEQEKALEAQLAIVKQKKAARQTFQA